MANHNENLEKDINDVFYNIAFPEEIISNSAFQEGLIKGKKDGKFEGYHLGFHRGLELGYEIGFYRGLTKVLLNNFIGTSDRKSDKIRSLIEKQLQLLDSFPECNSPNDDLLKVINEIRANSMALTEQEIIRQLNKLICFLEPLNPLLNSHLGSFFVEDMWNRHVPFEIQLELSNLNSVKNFIQAYPEIIRNKYSNDFAKHHPNLLNFVKEAINVSIFHKEKYSKSLLDLEDLLSNENNFQNCDKTIEKFMTSKKLHEVKITSKMVALISNITQSSHIADVGGGKGYLSSTLALNYSFKVLGLDFSEVKTCGAIKRLENLARLWNGKIFCTKVVQDEKVCSKKAQKQFIQSHYKQVIAFVKPDTNIEDILKQNFNEEVTGITLTGLHTCGDLASTCLKMFLSSKKIKGIINVGCCYNLINEEFINANTDVEMGIKNYGFPMSNFLKAKNYKLGQNARMVACHSLDRFSSNSGFEFSQTSLFYRAVFEIIKQRLGPFTGQGKIGRFGKKSSNFYEYMFTALKKLGISVELTESDIDKLYKSYLDKKPFLTAFYLLRISLAPVVESIILLDRILYLIENDINNVYLVPLFNLKISPRGFGIIAWKDFKNS